MNKNVPDSEPTLTAATRRVIAQHGLARLSLREVAQASGRSTFAVTRTVGNKAGLLSAALSEAIHDDKKFHQDFFANVATLQPDPMHQVDIVMAYLKQRRSTPDTSRVLLEMFLGADAEPGVLTLLMGWHAMRKTAWQHYFVSTGVNAKVSTLWIDMLLFEEFFSVALGDNLAYNLLLREALRALFAKENTPQTLMNAQTPILQWLNLPEPAALYETDTTTGVKRKLLETAADMLIDEGFVALTNGRISRRAQVSTSMISYHFGSMQNFVKTSIVHALRRDVPNQAFLLQSENSSTPSPSTVHSATRWATIISKAAQRSKSETESDGEGFYVKYARIVSHACLLAQTQPELGELLLWLRAREGLGTYQSQSLRPIELRVGRLDATHFAVWIKGYSLVNDRLRTNEADSHPAHVLEAARCFALLAGPGQRAF